MEDEYPDLPKSVRARKNYSNNAGFGALPDRLGKDERHAFRLERASKVMAMRASGATFQAIAATLGVHHAQVMRDCAFYCTYGRPVEEVAAHRTRIATAYDALRFPYWKAAVQGHLESAKFVKTILDREAKMFGLDMPTQVELVTPDSALSTFYANLDAMLAGAAISDDATVSD